MPLWNFGDGTATWINSDGSYGTGSHEWPTTLYPALAMTLVVRWPPRTALEGDLAEEKIREVQQTGLVIHPKNTYGLRNGSILTYWEKLKDPNRHAQLTQAFLEKDTTYEKMTDANVVAIIFHENCKIEVNDMPFQSYVLYPGKTKAYKFKSKNTWVPSPMIPSSNGERQALRIPSEEGNPCLDKLRLGSPVRGTSLSLAARLSDSATPVLGFGDLTEKAMQSDAVSVQNGSCLHTGRLNSDSKDFLQQTSGDHYKSPSPIDTAPELLSPSPSSSIPRKRPLTLSDNMDGESKKKGKGESHTFQGDSHGASIGCSFPPSCSSPCMSQLPGTDSSRLRIASSSLKAVELVAERERRDHQLEKTQLQEECAEVKKECERIKQVEQATLKRNDELECCADKLRRSEKACEDSLARISDMRILLEDAESSKKVLQKTLQDTEEECRRLRLREEGLLSASLEATKKAERIRDRNASADEANLKAKSLVEEALRLAEARQKAAEEKQRIAEDALASERLQRIAAEETFLDIQSILHGLHSSFSADATKATANDAG